MKPGWQKVHAFSCQHCGGRPLLVVVQVQEGDPRATIWTQSSGYGFVKLRFCTTCDPNIAEVYGLAGHDQHQGQEPMTRNEH